MSFLRLTPQLPDIFCSFLEMFFYSSLYLESDWNIVLISMFRGWKQDVCVCQSVCVFPMSTTTWVSSIRCSISWAFQFNTFSLICREVQGKVGRGVERMRTISLSFVCHHLLSSNPSENRVVSRNSCIPPARPHLSNLKGNLFASFCFDSQFKGSYGGREIYWMSSILYPIIWAVCLGTSFESTSFLVHLYSYSTVLLLTSWYSSRCMSYYICLHTLLLYYLFFSTTLQCMCTLVAFHVYPAAVADRSFETLP